MIAVDGLGASAGSFRLRDVALRVEAGAWGILLGPTGSGKTTLLESIAGLRQLASGRVRLGEVDVTDLAPESRGVGMVHQHGYLFPHLSVFDNIAYGTRDERAARDVAARLGLEPLALRGVASLSGGERQVVALARALAPHPRVLLLDEPFAALDPRRRPQVRAVLRDIQREQALTVLHVTHDFPEARLLGDVAAVLVDGTVVDAGAPGDVFARPASPRVAEFLGVENVLAGTVHDDAGALTFRGDGVALVVRNASRTAATHAAIRAEDIILGGPVGEGRNVVAAQVMEVVLDGLLVRVTLRAGGTTLVAVATSVGVAGAPLAPGMQVTATIDPASIHLC